MSAYALEALAKENSENRKRKKKRFDSNHDKKKVNRQFPALCLHGKSKKNFYLRSNECTVLEWLNHGRRYVRRLTLGFDLSLGRLLPFSTFMRTFDKILRLIGLLPPTTKKNQSIKLTF